MRSSANPFEDPLLTRQYDRWYLGPGRREAALEKRLLTKLLAGFPSTRTVVEIGCGTGYFTRSFQRRGFQVVGLDLSAAMLREAGPDLRTLMVQGDALDLPFADRAFDLAALITSLEFLSDPLRAVSEAARVSRQGILFGALNRWSVLALRYRCAGKRLWRSAHFFSPPELRRLIRSAVGRRVREISWRTTLWPLPGVEDLPLPWGGFIGLSVQLEDGSLAAGHGGERRQYGE